MKVLILFLCFTLFVVPSYCQLMEVSSITLMKYCKSSDKDTLKSLNTKFSERVELSLNLNQFRQTYSNLPFYKFRELNYRLKFSFSLENVDFGIELSLINEVRALSQKVGKIWWKENYIVFEMIPNVSYCLGKGNRHILRHGFGFDLFRNFTGQTVSKDYDYNILRFESIQLFNDSQSSQPFTLNKINGFLETGYDFYIYKGLHLSLTGRATLLSYNLNFDSNGNPTDEKRLGLNYMLFYGLGYTFGRDK